MDMRKLLEAMYKFAGEPEQKAGDQVRGTEKAKKTKDNKHPFQGRLVGAAESKDNFLKGLNQIAEDTALEQTLAERWAQFKEEAFKDTEDKRPARKGSRPNRGHEPKQRYKKIKETDVNPIADPMAAKKALAATTQLKSITGTTAPAPNLAKALDAASQGTAVNANDAKILEPMMDIVSKTATDPKLANQFKMLAQQAKTTP